MHSKSDLREAIIHGAVKRIRPKFMTVATMFVAVRSPVRRLNCAITSRPE